jgi:hypothetical protein
MGLLNKAAIIISLSIINIDSAVLRCADKGAKAPVK